MKKSSKILPLLVILLHTAYTLPIIHGPLGGLLITAGIITGNEGRKEFLRASLEENNIQMKFGEIKNSMTKQKAKEAITAEEWEGKSKGDQQMITEFREQCEKFVIRYQNTLMWGSITGLFMRAGVKNILRGIRI